MYFFHIKYMNFWYNTDVMEAWVVAIYAQEFFYIDNYGRWLMRFFFLFFNKNSSIDWNHSKSHHTSRTHMQPKKSSSLPLIYLFFTSLFYFCFSLVDMCSILLFKKKQYKWKKRENEEEEEEVSYGEKGKKTK